MRLAIIGGTGLTALNGLEVTRRKVAKTPFGIPSSPFVYGRFADRDVIFLARHGHGHTIPPHQVNYRANIWGLKDCGVTHIIAVTAVGGIHADMAPEHLVIPHQLVDYTYGRDHTFFENDLEHVTHIDFTHPYCPEMRDILIQAAQQTRDITVHTSGVYGVTQGPRLETAAEIDRMDRDGCDIVGMTSMPEASLAKELNLCYANCSVIANKAAGRGAESLTLADIQECLHVGMANTRQLLEKAIALLEE
jgi:5'-methylthioinosine phosphorylase